MTREQEPASWDYRAPAYQSRGAAALAEEQRDPVELLAEKLIEQRKPPFDRDMGTINALIVQLQVLYPARTAALRLTDKNVRKALRRLGAEQRTSEVYEQLECVWMTKPYIWCNAAGWKNAGAHQVRLHMDTGVRLTTSTGALVSDVRN